MNNAYLVYDFIINFHGCTHSEKHTAYSHKGMESLTSLLFERQNELCGKCYSEYCEKYNKIPWWSKK